MGAPPYSTHRVLLEHDRMHGDGAARCGGRVHWLRTWLVQKTRQWSRHDTIVCGSNPVLGALACAGLVRGGLRPLWLCSNAFDAWDYPLAMAGAHDDLLAGAGLPRMGEPLFDALGARCAGRAQVAWGLGIDYVFEGGGEGGESKRLCFAKTEARREGAWGAARLAAQTMAARGFRGVAPFVLERAPARHGGGPRAPILESPRVVWTSDRMDGVSRLEAWGRKAPGEAGGQAKGGDARLGRARWHAQEPLDFAEQSREDLRLALAMGGWA